MLKALPSLFPNLLGTSSSARVEFYDKFQPEADEYDRDFMKKYDEDLHHLDLREYSCRTYVGRGIYVVLLGVQAGLFSAVTSAFIIGVQQNLQPDYQQMSYDLLKFFASVQLGTVPTGPDAAFPEWTGLSPCCASNGSIVMLRLRCADPLSIAVGIDNSK